MAIATCVLEHPREHHEPRPVPYRRTPPGASTRRLLDDPVIEWNEIALSAAFAGGLDNLVFGCNDALHESRMMAMMHVAIHDALNAIDRRYQPYAFDGHAPDGLAEDKVEALLGEDGGSNGRVSDGSARLVELENRLAQVRERSMTEQEALGRVIDPEPVIGQAVRRELRAEVERVHRELLERFAGQMQTLASINRQLLELRPLHGESLLASGTNFLGHLHSSLTTE